MLDLSYSDKNSLKTHHIRDEVCVTRPKYREGRKLKAVKVSKIVKL